MGNKLINNLSRGLLKNFNKILQDKQFYTFGLNLAPTDSITDRVTKVTENKLADILSLNSTPYVILNVTWLGKSEYVYFIKNKTTLVSEIWLVNKGVKTLKYSNIRLNFQFNKLISSTFRVNFKGQRIIYFVDGYNNDRLINIDEVTSSDSIESLNLITYYDTTNTIDLQAISGGKLLQGNYIVAASFRDKTNNVNNIKVISNTVSIGQGEYYENFRDLYPSIRDFLINKNTTFLETRGVAKDAQTNKALKIKFRDEFIEEYQSMDIYVIRLTEETIDIKLLENIRLINEFVITGGEQFIEVGKDLSVVITNNILYNKSEVISQKDNRLIRANTEIDFNDYNFQSIANGVTVRYSINEDFVAVNTTSDTNRDLQGSEKEINDYNTTIQLQSISPTYLSNNNNRLNKTFCRDEVYALGVYFELDGGIMTDVFHIPGRLPNSNPSQGNWENTSVQAHRGNVNDSDFDTKEFNINNELTPRWKLYNTAIKFSGTDGLLGYYHTDEVYPDGYGFPTNGLKNSDGKSYIRHHKIPSEMLEPLYSGYNFEIGQGREYSIQSREIGLEFDISIPDELQNIIKKVHYTFAPKNNNNKNVLGKGITYSVNSPQRRQSDQLNRYGTRTNTSGLIEYYSAETLFNYKATNIQAKRIKPTSIYNGIIRYITRNTDLFPPNSVSFPNYPLWINSEGGVLSGTGDSQKVDSYNYKQFVRFDNVFYNVRRALIVNDRTTIPLNDVRFVDNNGFTIANSNSINFAGNQNSVLISMNMSGINSYMDLTFSESTYQLHNIDNMSNIMANYPLTYDFQNYQWQIPLSRTKYFDNVLYVTLLTDNRNIDTDLMNLKYTTPYEKNGVLVGDCFIDILHGKRGFSMTYSPWQRAERGIKSNKRLILSTIDSGSSYRPHYEDNVQLAQFDDYFAFLTETQINIRMRDINQENTYYPIFTMNTDSLSNEFEKRAGTQDYYHINEGYNENNIYPRFANDLKIEDVTSETRRLENRIVYSEVQNMESRVDNYRKALANNYRDIITTRGPIYKMFTKQEKLYAITRDSSFIINTSNQTLKTDSGYNISVGTGDFFSLDSVELMALTGGVGGTSSKLSLVESPYGYLYIDKYRSKVFLFNETLLDLNELGLYEDFKLSIEDYIPEIVNETDNPQLGFGISAGYDPKLKRFLITKKDYTPLDTFMSRYKGVYDTEVEYSIGDFYLKEGLLYDYNNYEVDLNDSNLFENKSFTISFDPLTQTWISYHDYLPSRYIPNSEDCYPVNENVKYFSEDFADKQILEVLFNDEINITKVFDSIQVDSRSENVNGQSTNDFFTSVIAYNEKQSTGILNLSPNNLTKKETYWNINQLLDNTKVGNTDKLFTSKWDDIKNNYFIDKVINNNSIDHNKPWNRKGRLRDKYLIVRFIRENTDNKKLYCNLVSTNIRISNR